MLDGWCSLWEGAMKKWLKGIKNALAWIAESAREAIFKPKSK
jgi:hypothetical protein